MLAAACQKPAAPALSDLEGQILPRQDVLVLPNRAWRRHQTQRDTWFFGRSASMLCHVTRSPTVPLTFIFQPEHAERSARMDFSWNGEDVTAYSRVLMTGEIEISIPPDRLTPGLHFLALLPEPPGDQALTKDVAHSFLRIAYRLDGETTALLISDIMRYRYLADLLQLSLSSSEGQEKMSGFVFKGNHSEAIQLPSAAGGTFWTKVQNSSNGPGKVTAQAGDQQATVEFKAHQRRLIRLEVPPGIDRLRLTADTGPDGLVLWGAPLFRPVGAPSPPPVLFITLDTTRRDVLAAHGGDPRLTPHLNALAERATLFERAATTAPWTLPSHASMFTGLYPTRHGAGVASDHLEGQFETLAERLKRHGYLTAGFAGGTLTSFRFGLGQGFQIYDSPRGFETRAEPLTTSALNVLEEFGLLRQEADRLPFFLFLNYFDPHYPFTAPESFQDRFGLLERLARRSPDDPWTQVVREPGAAWDQIVEGELQPRAEDIALLRDAYHAEVAYMDAEIGRLLGALREAGIFDEALILIAADHGELLGEGGFFSHSARLDGELTDIPMIIKWPHQKIPRRVSQPVSVVDLFPTVLRAAGLAVPEQDGLVLDPGGGLGLERRTHVVMEEHDTDFHRLSPFMKISDHLYGFQNPERKQLTWDEGDLCYESHEGSWRSASCDDALTQRVWRWRRWLENEAFEPQVQRIGINDEDRAKLKALGYL